MSRLQKRKWSPWITVSIGVNPFRICWTVIEKATRKLPKNLHVCCAICCRLEVDNGVISVVAVDNVSLESIIHRAYWCPDKIWRFWVKRLSRYSRSSFRVEQTNEHKITYSNSAKRHIAFRLKRQRINTLQQSPYLQAICMVVCLAKQCKIGLWCTLHRNRIGMWNRHLDCYH